MDFMSKFKIDKSELKLTKFKIVGLAGALVAFIGLFLPFLTAKVSLFGYSASESVKLIEGRDGKVALVIIIIGAALLFLKKFDKATYACAGALLFIVLYDGVFDADIADINSIPGASITRGIGLYVMLIGIIAFAVGTFLEYKNDTKEAISSVQPQQAPSTIQPTYNAPQQPVYPQQPQQPQQDTFNQNNSNNNL